VTPCGWEDNRRSGVALAMRHRLKWFIHPRAHSLDREMSTLPMLSCTVWLIYLRRRLYSWCWRAWPMNASCNWVNFFNFRSVQFSSVHVLWKASNGRSHYCSTLSVSPKTTTFYFLEHLSQKSADFCNFWCTHMVNTLTISAIFLTWNFIWQVLWQVAI